MVRREACWVISNITAGSRNQVESVLARESLLKKVLNLFDEDATDVKREICYIFSNMAHAGEPQHIFNLYRETNILRYYINLLGAEEKKSVEVSLECLFVVLAQGEKFKVNGKNPLVLDLHTMGAIEIL